ncbi:MAG: aryl-alcohol dehydrogenase-like predicted oxidoreductase [Myxococcota bacterium]|jgi:aryl-alcohol dehydrogenase-like predicted oxidoreductase
MTEHDFSRVDLPSEGKRVLRLGLAGNYGLDQAGVEYAAERGVNFWLWGPRMTNVTPVLKRLLAKDRDKHVVSVLGNAMLTGGPRRDVDKARKLLGVDTLDCYKLGWLGKMSRFSDGIQDTLRTLRTEGKVKAVGCSIHDRPRAGELARDSLLDTFMLRYNAKHPGAERDVFPHLAARNPTVIAYTATSWRQLLKPVKGLEMPPWPGDSGSPPPMTAGLCYRFCLSSPHVHVCLTGPASRQQLDENLGALELGALSTEEDAWVREYGRRVKAKTPIQSASLG